MGNFYSKNDVSEQTYPADNTLITLNKATTYDKGEPTGSEDFVSGRNYYLAYQISKNGTKKATSLIISPTPFQTGSPPAFNVESFDVRLKKTNDFNFSIRFTLCCCHLVVLCFCWFLWCSSCSKCHDGHYSNAASY